MNFWKRAFTPKNTEEIKPGLFVQQRGKNYKVITPIIWEGKWRLKNQIGLRNLFVIILVLLIASSYYFNVKTCRDFTEDPCKILSNLVNYCLNLDEKEIDANFEWEIEDDKREDTISIQDSS